ARLLLYRDPLYLALRWTVVVHCLLVLVSMYGIAVLKYRENSGLIALGALFFSVFGITEIARMLTVLGYLNPLRAQYLQTTDPALQQMIRYDLDHIGMVLTPMFLLFILAFALGNLCYGLCLIGDKGTSRWLGAGFLAWSAFTLLAFFNAFWELSWVDHIVEVNNRFYQPVFRLVIGIWLLNSARKMRPG
ncbi:MAG: hypothetical protein R2791_19145, partial [Saprospiraceae bacterium]